MMMIRNREHQNIWQTMTMHVARRGTSYTSLCPFMRPYPQHSNPIAVSFCSFLLLFVSDYTLVPAWKKSSKEEQQPLVWCRTCRQHESLLRNHALLLQRHLSSEHSFNPFPPSPRQSEDSVEYQRLGPIPAFLGQMHCYNS